MERIDLDELPRWSPWPARIMGAAPWRVPRRTRERVEQEYDGEKYAACLRYAREQGEALTVDGIKRFESGAPLETATCISIGDALFRTTLGDGRDRYVELIRERVGVRAERCRTIVELGAGYGYNLWRLSRHVEGHTLVGGELSAAAVELADLLYRDMPRITVRRFDFFDMDAYRLLAEAEPPILVYTAHAIEQLPRCGSVIEGLRAYRDRIAGVLHFEPLPPEPADTSMLAMLRRRYVELNDYNTDLMAELEAGAGIRISDVERDVMGINPLNPTSFVAWEFA